MNREKNNIVFASMVVYTAVLFFMVNCSIAMTYDTAITIRNMNDMRVFASTIVALKGVEPLQYLENGWGYGYAGNFNSFKGTVKIYPFAHTYDYKNALVVDQTVCDEGKLAIRIPHREDIKVLIANHFPVSFASGYPNINNYLYKKCFASACNTRYGLAWQYPLGHWPLEKYFSSTGSFNLYKTACRSTSVSQGGDHCLYQIVYPSHQVDRQSQGDKESTVKRGLKRKLLVTECKRFIPGDEDISYFLINDEVFD